MSLIFQMGEIGLRPGELYEATHLDSRQVSPELPHGGVLKSPMGSVQFVQLQLQLQYLTYVMDERSTFQTPGLFCFCSIERLYCHSKKIKFPSPNVQ